MSDTHRLPSASARGGPDGRLNDRELSIFGSSFRPAVREAPDVGRRAQAPRCGALEREPAGRVVFPEHRHAAEKDEVEPSLRIDDRQPGVQSEVDLAIVLLPGLVSAFRTFAKRLPSMAHPTAGVPSSG